MTTQPTASQQIIEEVTSWPGIEAGPGRRGEYAFKVGSREIGHLHGDSDIRDVIELLRLNYDRVVARFGVPAQPASHTRA